MTKIRVVGTDLDDPDDGIWHQIEPRSGSRWGRIGSSGWSRLVLRVGRGEGPKWVRMGSNWVILEAPEWVEEGSKLGSGWGQSGWVGCQKVRRGGVDTFLDPYIVEKTQKKC